MIVATFSDYINITTQLSVYDIYTGEAPKQKDRLFFTVFDSDSQESLSGNSPPIRF